MQNLLFRNQKDDPLSLHFEQHFIPDPFYTRPDHSSDVSFADSDSYNRPIFDSADASWEDSYSYEINLQVDSGESGSLILKTEPVYYYPSAENDFIFSCDYIAPEGEVNFIFPDDPCSENIYLLSINTGENLFIEFGVAQDIDLEIIDGYSGEINFLILQEQNYGTFIQSEGPEAYWKLNETTGTQAIDFTGNNIAATYVSTSLGISSSVGSYSSVYLDGTNSTISGPPTLTGTAITQEVWVRPDADGTITLYTAGSTGTQGRTGQRFVIHPLDNGAGAGGGLSVGSNGIQVVSNGSSYTPVLLSHAYSLPSDTFTHIVITWDNYNPSLYINGQFIKNGLDTRAPFVAQGLPTGSAYGLYKGHLQDVAIYNRVLTATDIREHYLTGIGLHFIPRLDDVDSYTGQSGEVDTLDFIQYVNLEDIDGYTGETSEIDVSANIHFEYLDGYTGEVSENIELSIFESFEILDSTDQFITGETSHTELRTEDEFPLNDTPTGEYGNIDLETFEFIIFDSIGYTGEYGNIDLETFELIIIDSDAYSGETSSFELTEAELISLDSIGYTGESSDLGLSTDSILDADAYSGESIDLIFTDNPPAEIDSDAHSGEYGNINLSAFVIFGIYLGYTGEFSNASLEVFYPDALQMVAYAGEHGNIDLSTTSTIDVLFHTGEFSNLDVSNFPSIELETTIDTGEYSDLSIQETITFPSDAYSGENVNFDIDYIINLGMPKDAYTGEFSDVNLATEDSLDSDAYSGEDAEVYFAPPITFDIDGYTGEYGDLELSRFPPIELTGVGYNGQYGTISTLNFSTTLSARVYSGSVGTVEFSLPTIIEFETRSYSGESGILNALSFPFSIGTFIGYTGEIVTISNIQSEDNNLFYTGENIFITLSSTDNLNPVAHTGTTAEKFSLFVGAPGVFDLFRVYAGETFYQQFDNAPTAHFYVLFRTSIWTQCDIGSATYFDLATDDCCGPRPRSNNILINMHRNDYLPEAVSYGNDVRLYVDLSCAIRFRDVQVHTGETSYFFGKTETFEIKFEEGTGLYIPAFDADETHKLCRGYFIPDGNWVVTELNDILLDTCYADQFVEGQTMTAALSDDIVIRLNEIGSGEAMIPNLILEKPWLIEFWTGEILYFDLALEGRLEPRAYAGEVLRPSLWFPPITAYAGEYVEVTVVDDLFVRFLDEGCLVNKFRFQNASGDEIPELYNPTPVEGEPFYSDITAECYIEGDE